MCAGLCCKHYSQLPRTVKPRVAYSCREYFPNKQQWGSGDLRKLYAETVLAIRKKAVPRATRRVNLGVVELRRLLKQSQTECSNLRAENERLRKELAAIKGRKKAA